MTLWYRQMTFLKRDSTADVLAMQGRMQGGVGVKKTLELDILQKLCYLRKGD